ncbi:hypothetical protein OJF2_39030 [Aquisphaera giovannonii]|uniref:Uncharacterized protein n=2 Tax=Aquisphaera giovannonii TaxID=406548 RepID=A0A5B9W428_9BACT|nr:hypothetical protein OJF2_39030 [Aquisphaera giovannonii]
MERRPFSRFIDRMGEVARGLLRREPSPGMIGAPPSARSPWHDPARHARDFGERHAGLIDYHVESRMLELGIDPVRIGWGDVEAGIRHAAFHPHVGDGGNVSPDGRIIVGSGVFSDELLRAEYGDEAAELFRASRTRDRLDSILAHEYEEHAHGMSHAEAVKHAPETELPISDRARAIARAMEKGWKREIAGRGLGQPER